MIKRRRWLTSGIAVGLLAAPMTAAAAAPTAATAVSVAGRVAYGFAAGPLPGGNAFEALLVDPGVVVSGTPGSSVDLSRPWAQLREETPNGSGDVCQTVLNPARWSMTVSPQGGAASFDATCQDGKPYSFYRISWVPAEALGMMSWFGLPGESLQQKSWGAPTVSHASGNLTYETAMDFWDVLQVCGWTGQRFDCGYSWSPVTGASGPGVAGSADIWPAQVLVSTMSS